MANISKGAATTDQNNHQPAADIKQMAAKEIKEQITRIFVDDIEPNPKQPRTHFDEQKLKELAESIKQYDVVQPVTVSKLPSGKYRLISGERRWRAAKLAQHKDIPAYIKLADDDELLELAILENLQREDLSPMEQARAFRQLAEECKLNAKEIALRQGKSEYFVRQQIKLTELIPQWQNILSKDGISISIALQIAVLPEALQKDLYKNNVSKEDEKADKPNIQINQYNLNQYKGILSEANFDINDPALDAKAGACTACPFNTACNSLFPEEVKNPKCNNIACFNNKSVIHLNREFKKAKDDPTIVLVYEAYNVPDYVKKLKGEGIEILKLGYSDDCKEIREPQKPDWKEYEKWAKHQNLSAKETKKNFDKDVDNYEFNKEVFNKNVASGRYKRAFVVYDGHDRQTGKYVYVELNPKKSKAKNAQKVIAGGSATKLDIDNEIQRLREREARAKQLDQEKIQEQIVLALKDNKTFKELPKAANRTDNALINFLLVESISYSNRSAIEKALKLNSGNLTQFYNSIAGLSKQKISFLIRQIILDKYGTSSPNSKGGLMVRKMAESLGEIPIAKIEKSQKEIALKRQNRLTERIGELNKQKQKIASESKNNLKKEQGNKEKEPIKSKRAA